MQHIHLTTTKKEDQYKELYQQLISILEGERDIIARMATICSAIKEAFDFYWIGFYRVDGDELVAGPYIGTLGCLRIKKGKGVCGTCWQNETTIVVKDVHQFPGHIACSSASKSEIVVPVFDKNKSIIAVLDIDSNEYAQFDEEDKTGLEKIVELVVP
ncbi:MAG: GAF domain-containing protein [Bacteroidetes bacterium]|jgi:GAF domain-containing protein|nr:MAG: GAF domain-containing protein [Bacteroidota bacterium]